MKANSKTIKNEGKQLDKSPEQYWFDKLVGGVKYFSTLPQGTQIILGENYLQFTEPESGKVYKLELKEVKRKTKIK